MANEVTDVEIRLAYSDAGESIVNEVLTAPGTRTNPGGTTPTTDPRQLPIVPKTGDFVAEDDKIILYAKPVSTTNFDTNSELEIPASIQNIKTGVIRPVVLARSDFFSSDQTMTVAVWNRIGAYTIGAQERVKIGQDIAENSRIRAVIRSA